jgi:2-phosphoglycerate kinase
MTKFETTRLQKQFARVLWIGGATDAGKTTVARWLCEYYGWPLYEYDRTDIAHHQRLAKVLPDYKRFIDASLDERWLHPEPEVLLERALDSFGQRIYFIAEELRAWTLPKGVNMLVEGFGLTPDLLNPLLSSPYQAIWFIPTEVFKQASMERRGKPAFAKETSNPEKVKQNLYTRDRLLARTIERQARAHDLRIVEVDGSKSVEELAKLVIEHFAPFIQENV